MLNWVYAYSNFNFDEKKETFKKNTSECVKSGMKNKSATDILSTKNMWSQGLFGG